MSPEKEPKAVREPTEIFDDELSLEELNAIKSMQEISLLDEEFKEAEESLNFLFEKDFINENTRDLIKQEIAARHKEHFTFRTKPFRTCDAMNYTAYTFMRVLISKLREPGGG